MGMGEGVPLVTTKKGKMKDGGDEMVNRKDVAWNGICLILLEIKRLIELRFTFEANGGNQR